MDKSLGKVTRADGSAQTIEYAVDERLNPTLKLGDRLIACKR